MFVTLKLPPHKCFWIFSQFPLCSSVTGVLCSEKCLFCNLEQQASWGLSQHIMAWHEQCCHKRSEGFLSLSLIHTLTCTASRKQPLLAFCCLLFITAFTFSNLLSLCWLIDRLLFSPRDLQQLLYMRLRRFCAKLYIPLDLIQRHCSGGSGCRQMSSCCNQTDNSWQPADFVKTSCWSFVNLLSASGNFFTFCLLTCLVSVVLTVCHYHGRLAR